MLEMLVGSCLLAYVLLILGFVFGFFKYEKRTIQAQAPKHRFSIVIPFRNEAEHLEQLLESLSLLNYPTNFFEIILINDESSDDYASILSKSKIPNLQCINTTRHSQSPKKDALESGINLAKYPWIVSTDADCVLPENWLIMFNQLIEEKACVFIGGPVIFTSNSKLHFYLQELNLFSLLGITIGSFGIRRPLMCNGANLCFSKEAFYHVNGYEGNNSIASGDDVFLLEKMVKTYPKKVHYLKSTAVIVLTHSEKTWKKWFQQQLRWASKTRYYSSLFTKITGVLVYLTNLLLLSLFIFAIFESVSWTVLLGYLMIKSTVDVLLMFQVAHYFKNYQSLKYLPVFIVFYPIFLIGLSFFIPLMSYHWKERKISPSNLSIK